MLIGACNPMLCRNRGHSFRSCDLIQFELTDDQLTFEADIPEAVRDKVRVGGTVGGTSYH